MSYRNIFILVPTPNRLFTDTLPPINSIIYLHTLNPSPVPFVFIALCSLSFWKSVNNLSMFSFLIPIPLSSIYIFSFINLVMSLYVLFSIISTSSITWSSKTLNFMLISPPWLVNLMLFDKKFNKIYKILLLSVWTL